MAARFLWLALTAAMLAVLALMHWVTLPALARETGGLPPFDLRPMGYDLAAAETYLRRLGQSGRTLYLQGQLWLDTALPVMLAAVLGWSFLVLCPRRLALALAALAAAGAVADLLENARIAALLQAEVPDAAQVAAASLAGQVKWALDGAALLALAVALAWHLWRRAAAGQGRPHPPASGR